MKNKYIVFAALAMIAVGFVGCEETTTKKQEEMRTQLLDRADRAVPTPQINNFLTRKAVAKWMKRNDVPTKVWHIYLLGDNGNVVQYYTASTRPISFATFLTPPDKVEDRMNGDVVRQAPSADGVYYGKGAANSYFFFDSPTDRLITINGTNFVYADAPFELDIEPVMVQMEAE